MCLLRSMCAQCKNKSSNVPSRAEIIFKKRNMGHTCFLNCFFSIVFSVPFSKGPYLLPWVMITNQIPFHSQPFLSGGFFCPYHIDESICQLKNSGLVYCMARQCSP